MSGSDIPKMQNSLFTGTQTKSGPKSGGAMAGT
jgi:hypothetical protein